MHRVAFLGGSIKSAVGRAHFSALNLDGEFKVTGGCFSRNFEVNRETATSFGIEEKNIHSSIDDLILNIKNYDVLVLLTPTPVHAENLVALRSIGIPVICEKALTNSVASSIEVGKIYERKSLSVIFNYTGYPMVREIKKRIETREIGDIQQIIVEMPQEGFEKKDLNGNPIMPQAWRLKDESIPTLSLDLGVHLHSLLYFLTTETPEKVFSSSRSFGNFQEVIDTQTSIISFPSGMLANYWITKSALGERNGLKFRVFGSQGSYSWVQEKPDQFIFTNKFGTKNLIDRGDPSLVVANYDRYQRFKAGHPTGFIEGLANYYQDINFKIRGNLPTDDTNYVFGWKESHMGLLLMDAMQRSAQTGRELSIL